MLTMTLLLAVAQGASAYHATSPVTSVWTAFFITQQSGQKPMNGCLVAPTREWQSPRKDNGLTCKGAISEHNRTKNVSVQHGTHVKYFPLPESEGEGVGHFVCENGSMKMVTAPCEPLKP